MSGIRIIKKITIDNFRSIRHADIEVSAVNVISGLNDTGKSNALKALNLFFNGQTDFGASLKFDDDYSKIGLASAQRAGKQKQQIKIRVALDPLLCTPLLKKEKEVWIERVYYRSGEVKTNYSTDDAKKKASITNLFHNKIDYFYIPALKGPDVLRFLLGRIGEHELISSEKIATLNEEVNRNLGDLGSILNAASISSKTTVGFPVLVRDFWENLSINTQYDEFFQLQEKVEATGKGVKDPLKEMHFQVPLSLRGEGIKSMYVPPLLRWIQKQKPSNHFVWGVDEPENSLEFRKAREAAALYFDEYSKDAQMFLTSHSFAFIFPEDNEEIVSVFKCKKGELGETEIRSMKSLFEGQSKTELAEELGILEIQSQVYKQLKAKEDELALQRKQIVKFSEGVKPLVLFEGKTDEKIVREAWTKLYGIELPFDTSNGGGASFLANTIKNSAFSEVNRSCVVALFDHDREGVERFDGLSGENTFNERIGQHKLKHNEKNIYAALLPVPDFRSKYIDLEFHEPRFQFFEIEHYFSDEVLRRAKVVQREKDGRIYLKDNRDPLNRLLSELPRKEFKHFSVLFDEIKSVLPLSNK